MSTTGSTVSRRDAAIAAALAGAVVVVLGYASGLGIVEPATRALAPSPPAAPPSVVPEAAPTAEHVPAPVVAPQPAVVPAPPLPDPPLPDPTPLPDHPSHPMPTEPTEPTEPTQPVPDPTDPSPDPTEPPAGGPECSSLLEGLPVVGPATVPLTALLSDVLATVPTALGPAPSPATSEDPASLSCILGIGGQACCEVPDPDQDAP